MKEYDVVIVGAGPAGLKCAEVLAKNNKKVLVLEKKEIIGDKVCAGGVTLKDIELGIPNRIIQRKFTKLIIHTPHHDKELISEKPFIATVNRKELGKWMEDNARQAGAEILTNSRIEKINKKTVSFQGKKVEYKYLVGADGSNSIVRKHLQLPVENLCEAFQYVVPKNVKDIEIFIDQEKFGVYYLYIFPHKKITYVGTGTDLSRAVHQPVYDLKVKDIKKNLDEFIKNKFEKSKNTFEAAIINYDFRGFEFENIFLAGDAGGFASGATGEGIYNAIISGKDIAWKIIDKNYKCIHIEELLKIKRMEEKILRHMESSKTLSKIEWESFMLLIKSKWLQKQTVKVMSEL